MYSLSTRLIDNSLGSLIAIREVVTYQRIINPLVEISYLQCVQKQNLRFVSDYADYLHPAHLLCVFKNYPMANLTLTLAISVAAGYGIQEPCPTPPRNMTSA